MVALLVGGAAMAFTVYSLEMTTMPKSTRNTGKHWTPQEGKQLKDLAKGNTPTRVIGLKLGRTEDGVRYKAAEKGVSLRPTNQSPYNRGKK
jgi:hypothetical protein